MEKVQAYQSRFDSPFHQSFGQDFKQGIAGLRMAYVLVGCQTGVHTQTTEALFEIWFEQTQRSCRRCLIL